MKDEKTVAMMSGLGGGVFWGDDEMKEHVSTKAKKWQYHSVKNKEKLNGKINAYLQNIYIKHYGERY